MELFDNTISLYNSQFWRIGLVKNIRRHTCGVKSTKGKFFPPMHKKSTDNYQITDEKEGIFFFSFAVGFFLQIYGEVSSAENVLIKKSSLSPEQIA